MKVFIPEKSILWTTTGICFGKEIQYGTEIFTIDQDDNIVPVPITTDVDEPEELKVRTIITTNSICTSIPPYLIRSTKKKPIRNIAELVEKDQIMMVDSKYVNQFREFHNKHTTQLFDKSQLSAIGALYLGMCGIKANKQAVYFAKSDENSMRSFAKEVQEDLEPEFGGSTSCQQGIANEYNISDKKARYMVLYRSDKFYKLRVACQLTDDRIPISIYSNGINIYFGFLRSLFGSNNGFMYHLSCFSRGAAQQKDLILNISWSSKIRKLLQNSCLLWKKYYLSMHKSRSHMSINELKIEKYTKDIVRQSIIEIKEHLENCYEIDVPLGHKIIIDGTIIIPTEISPEEIKELETFEEERDAMADMIKIRKKTILASHNPSSPYRKIGELAKMSKVFYVHVIGVVKNKGNVSTVTTRYGKTTKINTILVDESGEIKLQLWGDTAEKITKGDILEISNGYIKNGTLKNTLKGFEKVH